MYVCRLSETCTLPQEESPPCYKPSVEGMGSARGYKGWEGMEDERVGSGVHVERWERSGGGTNIKATWPTLVTLESNTESELLPGPEYHWSQRSLCQGRLGPRSWGEPSNVCLDVTLCTACVV